MFRFSNIHIAQSSPPTQQIRLLKKTVDGLLLKTQNRTLKLWNMSRFCCLNWKYWASSLKVSIWSNFLARRKRRMKSSSVRRKPMSGLVTIMSRTFTRQTGSQTNITKDSFNKTENRNKRDADSLLINKSQQRHRSHDFKGRLFMSVNYINLIVIMLHSFSVSACFLTYFWSQSVKLQS